MYDFIVRNTADVYISTLSEKLWKMHKIFKINGFNNHRDDSCGNQQKTHSNCFQGFHFSTLTRIVEHFILFLFSFRQKIITEDNELIRPKEHHSLKGVTNFQLFSWQTCTNGKKFSLSFLVLRHKCIKFLRFNLVRC